MNSTAAAVYVTREHIIALLSDDEVSKVSNAEATQLAAGDEYLDLEDIKKGVTRATGPWVATGSLLARKAVQPRTWAEVLTLLHTPRPLHDEQRLTVTAPPHSVMWLDHREARIFHLHGDRVESLSVHAAPVEHPPHQRGQQPDRQNPDAAKHFFHEVAQTLNRAVSLLVVGPSTAKLEFLRYVTLHHPALEQRIAGVETVDHPTEGQVVAYAKRFFNLPDRVVERHPAPWHDES